MARPADLPEWGSDETNNVAPSAGAKGTGYTAGQKPTSGILNWILFTIYSWINWLANAGNVVRAPGGGYAETAGWAHTADGFIQATTDGATWVVPLDLAVGTVVTSARFRCLPNGATATITCSIVKYLDETTTPVASTASTGGGALEWVTVASSFTVGDGEFYAAVYTASGGGANQRRASVVELNP